MKKMQEPELKVVTYEFNDILAISGTVYGLCQTDTLIKQTKELDTKDGTCPNNCPSNYVYGNNFQTVMEANAKGTGSCQGNCNPFYWY